MKKIIKGVSVLAAVFALGLSLVACNNGNGGGNGGGDNGGEAASVKGEVVDTGKFSALCPEGFLNIPQSDVFGEPDEDGNYPLNEEMVQFSYGAEDVFDAISKPSVTISLEEEGTDIDTIIEWSFLYDSLEETTFTVDGKEYRGANAEFSLSDEEDPYTYEIVYVEVGDRIFSVTVTRSIPGQAGDGLNVSDPTIQEIIKSIKLD